MKKCKDEKKKEEEKEREREYQEVVCKGKELLNVTSQNRCVDNGENIIKVKLLNGNVNVNIILNWIKFKIVSKVVGNDLGNGIFDWNLMSKFYVDDCLCNDQCMCLTGIYGCDGNGCLDTSVNCVSDIDWNNYDGGYRFFIIDDGG